jgi:hypothetical protein
MDLSPVLAGDGGKERDAALVMRMAHISNTWLASGTPTFRGVRTKTHTYARLNDGSAWFLFDNVADPLQMNNLADDPAHAGLQSTLDTRTTQLLAEADDPDDDDAIIDIILEENPGYGGVVAFRQANPKPVS